MSGVRGIPALRLIARRTREVADVLPGELQKAALHAVKPVDREVRAQIHRRMPSGYAPVLDRSFRTRVFAAGRGGVRVVASARGRRKERDLRALDAGQLRHPLWGNWERWYVQKTRPGFWSDPAREMGPDVRRGLEQALDRLTRKIKGG